MPFPRSQHHNETFLVDEVLAVESAHLSYLALATEQTFDVFLFVVDLLVSLVDLFLDGSQAVDYVLHVGLFLEVGLQELLVVGPEEALHFLLILELLHILQRHLSHNPTTSSFAIPPLLRSTGGLQSACFEHFIRYRSWAGCLNPM